MYTASRKAVTFVDKNQGFNRFQIYFFVVHRVLYSNSKEILSGTVLCDVANDFLIETGLWNQLFKILRFVDL